MSLEPRLVLKLLLNPVSFLDYLDIELWPTSRKIFEEFYKGKYTELIMICGRRSGKTTLCSVFGAYETFVALFGGLRHKHKLPPTTELFGLLCAAKEEQAYDTIFGAIKDRIKGCPLFSKVPKKFYKTGAIVFPDHHFAIKTVASTAPTEAGRTAKFVVIDEMTAFQETYGARSGWEAYRALTKSCANLKDDGHRFICGTPKHPSDILMELAHNAPDKTLVIHRPTWEMNPNISFEDLKDELQRDPIGFWRDYGASPYTASSVFFTDDTIFKVQDLNVLRALKDGTVIDLPPGSYVLALDPSLKGTRFGFALGSMEGDKIIIWGTLAWEPGRSGLNPLEIEKFVMKILTTWPVESVVVDTWHYAGLQARIESLGIPVIRHVVKREDYERVKELFWTNRLIVPADPILLRELKGLLISESGKIVCPKGGSKDVSDSVANCVWRLTQRAKYRVCLAPVGIS